MRNLRLLVALAVLCAIFSTIQGQNRGSSRYVPSSDDFDGESTRAPRVSPVRGVRRQRPTPAPEPAEQPEEAERSRQAAPSTTARRVPSREAAPQQFAPPAPFEPLIPEEPLAPAEPSPAPETRPKRRRTKKRKRPSTKPIEEKLDVTVNAAEPAPFDGSLPHPSDFPTPSLVEETGPQQFYPPLSATNRLPVDSSHDVQGGSRIRPEVQYSPDPPERGSYVPILAPVRVPAEGNSRLPPENTGRDYATPQRAPSNRSPSESTGEAARGGTGSRSRNRSPPVADPSEFTRNSGQRSPQRQSVPDPSGVTRNSGARSPQRSPTPPVVDALEVIRNSGARSPQRTPTPPAVDPSEYIRNSGARPPQDNIFRNDQPEDPEHAEVRLPLPEDVPIPGAIGYSSPPEESPVLNRFEEEIKSIEDIGRGAPVPSNRLPSPPELDSAYPSYLDSNNAGREPSRNTISNVRGSSRTESEPKDTGRQASSYQPPLQRSTSRLNAEDTETASRSRATEAPSRTRGPSRNRQEPPSEAPTRTRGSSRYQPEEDAPVRTRDQASRTRSGQRYQPEPVESGSIVNTRRQPVNPQPAIEEAHPADRVRSYAAPLAEDYDPNPVRNTMRSRPQFDSPEPPYEEPIYEEPVREEPVPYVPEEYQPEPPVQRVPPRRPEPPVQRAPQRQAEQPVQRVPQRPQSNRRDNIDTRSRSSQQNTRPQPQYEAPRRDAPRPQYEAPRRDQSSPPSRQQPPKARQQEASPRSPSKFKCPEPYGFFADAVQCDKYYECRNGTAFDSLCEDGLGFNEVSAPKFLRCDSLRDVDCAKRPELQEARPTKNCPRRYGLFPHESDCTKFWNCVDGTATEVQCPPGLTFNDDRATCDWADLVETSCKTEDLLGFTCPEPSVYDLQDGVYTTYPHPDNCQQHFVCLKGADGGMRPRLLSCNEGLVYSPDSKSCTRPDNVPGCEEFYGPRPKRKPAREEPEEEEPKPRRTRTRGRN